MSSELERAKVIFYEFFRGVPGLRFTKKEEFDTVVDALIDAVISEQNSQGCVHANISVDGTYCYDCKRVVRFTHH